MNSVLVDTNVWVDIVLKRPDFVEDSLGAVMVCIDKGVRLLVVGTSVKDVFYWAAKSAGADAGYRALDLLFSIADIAAVDDPVCKQALTLEKPDYEDGIIAACAQVEQVDAILSRDAAAFNTRAIPKFTPTELIAHLGYESFEF
ncbi:MULTISPECIES: PIN domain-containing protein [Gordonibacter]|uniref:PIN domain-containing protein n=1 Tax=Gordonibacter faecis TaxID=3047475 RepID=A0ABT7DPP9_9ACTN|nr:MULTISPECIES: PIN domain-containing protein [unclassified Gordonibacter]MDJ1651520.1 PIN domain-containing protein [Gordonibacter sp. KGMB12511]HIW75601.1 PIN domain-containing protein [Candidatus Gordonibacter avicola]